MDFWIYSCGGWILKRYKLQFYSKFGSMDKGDAFKDDEEIARIIVL